MGDEELEKDELEEARKIERGMRNTDEPPKLEIVEMPPEVDPEMKEAALRVMDILKDPEIQAKAKEVDMSRTNDIVGNVMGMFQPIIDAQKGDDIQRKAIIDGHFIKIDKQLEGIGRLLLSVAKELDNLRRNQYVDHMILERLMVEIVANPEIEAAKIDRMAGIKKKTVR